MILIKKEFDKQFKNWQKTITESNKTAKLVETVGKGFREVRANTVDDIDWSELSKDSWVLVFNDFDLTATQEYYKHGITNIILVSTDLSERQTVNKYFFNIVYPNTVTKMLVGDKLPWKAVLYLKAENYYRVGKNGKATKELLTRYYLEGEHKEYMNKEFDSVIANFPFSLGNDMTKFIIDNVKFKEGSFANVLPIKKYEKGQLYKKIIPTTIIQIETADGYGVFDGAHTNPIICRMSMQDQECSKNLSYSEFEQTFLVKRFGILKKFFDEQDKRIADELAEKRRRTFVEHNYGISQDVAESNKYNSKTTFMSGLYTCKLPNNGSPSIYSNRLTKTLKTASDKGGNYVEWNIRKVDKQVYDVYNKVYNKTGKYTISQIATVFETEQEKDNFVKYVNYAELHDKFRNCGLFGILVMALNKPTGCPYDYIIPRVDFRQEWTDEEILREYGYTETEIQEVLKLNDKLITKSWLKGQTDDREED